MGVRMGFEGLAFYGPAGAEATSPIPETRDMSVDYGTTKGNTIVREPDGSIPNQTENVTARAWSFSLQVLNDSSDAIITAMLAASYVGSPIALRTKDHAAGKGFNGDVILEHKHGKNLAGEQVIDFTAKPTRQAGRRPQYYV